MFTPSPSNKKGSGRSRTQYCREVINLNPNYIAQNKSPVWRGRPRPRGRDGRRWVPPRNLSSRAKQRDIESPRTPPHSIPPTPSNRPPIFPRSLRKDGKPESRPDKPAHPQSCSADTPVRVPTPAILTWGQPPPAVHPSKARHCSRENPRPCSFWEGTTSVVPTRNNLSSRAQSRDLASPRTPAHKPYSRQPSGCPIFPRSLRKVGDQNLDQMSQSTDNRVARTLLSAC
jgi:hypothetical protein